MKEMNDFILEEIEQLAVVLSQKLKTDKYKVSELLSFYADGTSKEKDVVNKVLQIVCDCNMEELCKTIEKTKDNYSKEYDAYYYSGGKYGGALLNIAKLSLGTHFFVANGAWRGVITQKNNEKGFFVQGRGFVPFCKSNSDYYIWKLNGWEVTPDNAREIFEALKEKHTSYEKEEEEEIRLDMY